MKLWINNAEKITRVSCVSIPIQFSHGIRWLEIKAMLDATLR